MISGGFGSIKSNYHDEAANVIYYLGSVDDITIESTSPSTGFIMAVDLNNGNVIKAITLEDPNANGVEIEVGLVVGNFFYAVGIQYPELFMGIIKFNIADLSKVDEIVYDHRNIEATQIRPKYETNILEFD